MSIIIIIMSLTHNMVAGAAALASGSAGLKVTVSARIIGNIY